MTTSPGGTVEFTGTLTNPGTTDIFLNGVVSVLPFPFLTVDSTPFFTFSPLFLAGGQTYSGPFFDVAVDGVALSGVYDGSFTIQGGDPNTFDNVAVQSFEVDVVPVPEPNTFILLTTVVVSKRIRRQMAPLLRLAIMVQDAHTPIPKMRPLLRLVRPTVESAELEAYSSPRVLSPSYVVRDSRCD